MRLIDAKVMFPRAPEPAVIDAALENAFAEFDIVTPVRAAMFLAQIDHESAGLTRLEESFAYTPARLVSLFPTRVRSLSEAKKLVDAGPEAIANRLYALRMGNGTEASGDGYRYRGRSPIHLTGKDNYRRSGVRLGVSLELRPDDAKKWPTAGRIATEFWAWRGCNAAADDNDFKAVTRLINGGLIGYQERRASWERFCGLFGITAQEK